jgi:hypothetical protein
VCLAQDLEDRGGEEKKERKTRRKTKRKSREIGNKALINWSKRIKERTVGRTETLVNLRNQVVNGNDVGESQIPNRVEDRKSDMFSVQQCEKSRVKQNRTNTDLQHIPIPLPRSKVRAHVGNKLCDFLKNSRRGKLPSEQT